MSKSKTDFVMDFAQILADEGEMFFTSGDIEEDYSLIKSTLGNQGYWAGTEYRYYFDENLNIVKVEERRFGS